MAKPIINIEEFTPSHEQQRAKSLERLSDAIAKNEAGLVQWLELVDQLRKRGVLDATVAFLERGGAIMQILIDTAEQPGYVGGIKNLIAAAQGFSELDTAALADSLQGLVAGTKEMAQAVATPKPLGVFGLMRALKDPDVSAGIAGGLAFIKGLGAAIRVRSDQDENVHV